MPAQRLAMRQVYEVLRLKWGQGLSDRKIAQSLGISRPAVAEYVRRAQAAGLAWPLPDTYDEGTLERVLFPAISARAPAPHLVPDWATVHRELKRKGVTLFLLLSITRGRVSRWSTGTAGRCMKWRCSWRS
jgi:transposase